MSKQHTVEKLAVIGCGTMGHSIALNAACAGIPVKVTGMHEEEISRAEAGIKAKLGMLAQHGMLPPAELPEILQRISFSTQLDEVVSGSTFVIEAAPEDLTLKQTLFSRVEALCDAGTVLASNTSGLSATQIAQHLQHPGRFIITHFWNPAHLVPLVEICCISATTAEVQERTHALLAQMGKKTIQVKKEVPGFVGNRLQYALLREAQYMLEEGIASKEDIDAAVTFGLGRRLPVTGPLLSADMGGLDVFAAISNYLFPSLSSATQTFPALQHLVKAGKFGSKSGEGYYEWPEHRLAAINTEREAALIHFMKQDRDR
jgi:3-hydroxybutyryl-CoA dehydrogenase